MWDVVILPLLIVISSFILASIVTPFGVFMIDKYGGKLFRFIKNIKSVEYTGYEIGSIYVPYPIKNIIYKLNLSKCLIKRTNSIKELKETDINPLPKDRRDIINRPSLELTDNRLPQLSHDTGIIAKGKDGKSTKTEPNPWESFVYQLLTPCLRRLQGHGGICG